MRGGPTEVAGSAREARGAPARSPIAPSDGPPPEVTPPPETPAELLAWADRYRIADRLDDVFPPSAHIVNHYGGWYWPGQAPTAGGITFRTILIDDGAAAQRLRRYWGPTTAARELLHEMVKALVAHRWNRQWLEVHGREPSSEPLAALLERLREEKQSNSADGRAGARPPESYAPTGIRVSPSPVPRLSYAERVFTGLRRPGEPGTNQVSLALLGWREGPLRWTDSTEGRPSGSSIAPDTLAAALDNLIDFLRDPRRSEEHVELEELLLIPPWRFALGELDRRLTDVGLQRSGGRPAGAGGRSTQHGPSTRVGFRLRFQHDGLLDIEPVVQKRQRNGTFSRGARLEWRHLTERQDLTELDRKVFRAFEDRFVASRPWTPYSSERNYGILCALIDHPAVYLEGEPGDGRPDLRQGRLRLRFVAGSGGGLTPQFDLAGHSFSAAELAGSLREGRLIRLHRSESGRAEILLAAPSPEATAIIQALAVAPGSFPLDAHDALATRLESLQQAMDIEFPSQWTRTITTADPRPLVRLELLASGALSIRLAVRPVKLGPVFAPGEGPTLVLEGQGQDRHGARRDAAAERSAAHALVERLALAAAAEVEAWCWRVNEGDPALHVVATLKDLGDAVQVEWADDQRLLSLGSVGRKDMRMQVADRRDWFGVEGGAAVDVGGKNEVVPLSVLFAAIRDGRRFVAVGKSGFVRIEDKLREALAQAEAATFDHRGVLEISGVASDALTSLVEEQAQIKACASFARLRERIREGATVTPRLGKGMKATLRPYQHAGVTWMTRMAHWEAGVILADEMGLGKTVQTLAVLSHRAKVGPALVVAPTSVAPNWLAEAKRFTPELRTVTLRGAERAALVAGTWTPGPGEVLVSSYAISTLEAETLAKVKFATLVVDEAQSIKNASTERAKALRELDAAWRIGLTGTPIENRLGEVWSIMRVLSPGLLGSWEQFRARYAVPIEKYGDDQRRRALAALLRPFILRRTKAEVAPELPARTEIIRPVRLSLEEQHLYEELRRATLAELAERKKSPERDGQEIRFVLLAALTRLRQLCCHPRLVYPHSTAGSSKSATLLHLLEDLRAEQHRVLVFSQFRSFLDLLAPRLRQHGHRVLVLDGTTPSDVREQRVAAFQAGEADVFLISLKAGGFGLNLTAADTVVHLDPWWNPAVEDQATARAHRIGQGKPVTAIRLVASGTIEESVLGLHAAKRALATGILDGAEVAGSLDTEQLVELIQAGFEPGPEARLPM